MKAATIPSEVAQNVKGAVASPVATAENVRTPAETIVHTSWDQNPRLPRFLKYRAVFSSFVLTCKKKRYILIG